MMHSLLGVLFVVSTLHLATVVKAFNVDTANLVKEFTVTQKDSLFGYSITLRDVKGKE